MFCKKCGAAVVGKFCSCCGNRVRTNAEEYSLAANRAKREFIRDMTHDADDRYLEPWRGHLAEACWLASSTKINRYSYDIDKLPAIRLWAEYLFKNLAATV